jgi:glycosyltransferase involved in cell wall biosynthesis
LRILLINHEFTISGASQLMFKLALHLRDCGHSCDVGAIYDGPLREEYAARSFHHLTTAAYHDYDVVICNTIFAASIVPSAAKFSKVIWWIHEGENGLGHVMREMSDLNAFRDASAIVFQTEFQRDSIYRSFVFRRDPARLFVIPVGVDVEASGPSIAKTRPLRIVCIGTIDERKRQGDLVRAVAALGRADVECVFIGKYYKLDEEERGIAAANPALVKILDETSNADALAWLRSADLFCLPSRTESQPISILEAASLGKPLVLTDLPSYRGIWRHQQNCLLYPVGDIRGLVNSLAALLSSADLRERLGAAARASAGQFSEAAFLARFDAVLEAIR